MKISVLTPSFNSGKYIEKSIDSVLNQSYDNWEHIVVDGNSTDGTVDILKQYPHLIWISEPDTGQSDAMNKAFEMCTGDIIVYLNADDFFYPMSFETIINQFDKNNVTDIVVGNLKILKDRALTLSENSTILWKDLSIIRGRFPLNPVSYFYKRKVQERIGLFPENEHYTMDYWFLLRAFYLFNPIKINNFLGCFVFVGTNKTSIIVDGFSIQKPHALKFCLQYTPMRLPYVYARLMLNPRNKTPCVFFVKKGLNYFKRFRRKLYKRMTW